MGSIISYIRMEVNAGGLFRELVWLCQRERDKSSARDTALFFGGGDEGFFLWAPGLIHLAAGSFLGGCPDKTKFAHGELFVLVADGWTEGAARHGAERVQVAGAGVGVE